MIEFFRGFKIELFEVTGKIKGLHRCWWRMLETKCVSDNYKMLVTVMAILVTNIHYVYIRFTNIHKHRNFFTNIQKLSQT